MTIAVIKTGGKQYKISKDEVLKVEKLKGEKGDKINFDKVLLISDEKGAKLQVGQPFVEGQAVAAEILEQGRDKKVIIIKYKRKTRYRRKQGHRQEYTKVKITKI